MAKAKPKGRRTVTTVEEIDNTTGAETELELDPPADAPVDADVFDELRALGGDDGVKFSVRRIPFKPGERGGYCATYERGELSMDGIRATFGGGRYQITAKGADGIYMASRTIDIVDLPKAADVAPANPMGSVAEIVAALKPAGDNSMMPMLLAMIAAQGEMFKALATRQPEKSNLTDILALINATKPAAVDPNAGIELLMRGLELGKDLGGGETGMMDIAKSGLDMIKPLIAANAANPQRAARRLAPPAALIAEAPPAVATAANEAATPKPTNGATPDMMLQKLNWLRAQVGSLCYQASRGGDAELYAAVMLDNLPAFVTEEEIVEKLSAPDAVRQLAQLDKRVTAHEAWFETFRQAVLDSFEPDESVPHVTGDMNSDALIDPGVEDLV